jgi:trehalose 6-phosphate phosphatase
MQEAFLSFRSRATSLQIGGSRFPYGDINNNCLRSMPATRSDPPFPAAILAKAWALFLDLDGTLLDIAPSPESVRVPRTLRHDLERASEVFDGALALISGRAIDNIDRILSPLRLPAAGQHGGEIRYSPEGPALPSTSVDLGGVRRLLTPVTGIPGVMIEDKGLSLAVHYRGADTRVEQLHNWILEALANHGDELEIIRGRCVFDIRPRGISKAMAVDRFMAREPFSGRFPVFIGDDKTDEDGFRAVIARGGFALQVGPNRSAISSSWIESPAAVRHWLRTLPGICARAAADG